MDELGRKSVQDFKESEKLPIIVVLENVRSAYNVGSVLRTADAFLLCAVYTVGYTAHPPHKQISKTALGADETVNTRHFRSTPEAIGDLRAQGYKIFCAEQTERSIKLQTLQSKIDHQDKVAVIFGNEVTGVEQSTIHLCDNSIEIPQLGMKHSLNVAVAAGVVIWEMVRTRIASANINPH